MKRSIKLYQLAEQLLMLLLPMIFNALPVATQPMIVGFIKDSLGQYYDMVRQPLSYTASTIRKVKDRAVLVKRMSKQALFQTNRNHNYENCSNKIVSKREPCCYEY